MTDLEKFIELYKSLGIELEPENIPFCPLTKEEEHICIRLIEGENDKFTGYSSFFSTVEFDKKGKFLNQGFWE
jgi:hypothetical protein